MYQLLIVPTLISVLRHAIRKKLHDQLGQPTLIARRDRHTSNGFHAGNYASVSGII